MSATVKAEPIDDEELDMSPFANQLCTKNVIMVSKGYIQAGLLVSHAISHIDVRPYGCNLCDYAARFEMNVRKHILKEHPTATTSQNGDPQTLSKLNLEKKSSDEMPKIVDNMDRKALGEFRDATLVCFPTEKTSILEWYTRKAIRYDRGDRKCRNVNVNAIQGKIVEKILLKKKLNGRSGKPHSLRSDPISFTSPAQRNMKNEIEKPCPTATLNGEIKTEIDDEIQQSTSRDFQQDEIDISLLFSKGSSPKIQSNSPRIAWKKSNLGNSNTKTISKSPISTYQIKEEISEAARSTSHQQVVKRSPITIYPSNLLAQKNDEITRLKSQLREKELALRKAEAHLANKIISINQLQKTNEQLQARLKETQRENGNETENLRLIQALKGKDQRIRELEEEIILHKDHKQKLHELLDKQSHNQNESTPTKQ